MLRHAWHGRCVGSRTSLEKPPCALSERIMATVSPASIRSAGHLRSESMTKSSIYDFSIWLLRRVGLCVGVSILLAACATKSPRGDLHGAQDSGQVSPEACVATALLQRTQARDGSYLIQPGDDLVITFYLNSEFNQDVIVRPDGRVSMQIVGTVQASGLTPQQLADNLDRLYLQELRAPGVTVTIKNMPSRQIFVEGEVSHPGAFPVDSGMTALQAVAAAGGFTPDASEKVVLIRRDACGQLARSEINLASATKASADDDQVLQSRDVIVATPSAIAKADEWVDHYLRRLMPVQPYVAANTPPL